MMDDVHPVPPDRLPPMNGAHSPRKARTNPIQHNVAPPQREPLPSDVLSSTVPALPMGGQLFDPTLRPNTLVSDERSAQAQVLQQKKQEIGKLHHQFNKLFDARRVWQKKYEGAQQDAHRLQKELSVQRAQIGKLQTEQQRKQGEVVKHQRARLEVEHESKERRLQAEHEQREAKLKAENEGEMRKVLHEMKVACETELSMLTEGYEGKMAQLKTEQDGLKMWLEEEARSSTTRS